MQIRRLNPDDAQIFAVLRLRALQEEPMSFSSSPEEHAQLEVSSIEQRLASSPDSFVLGAFDDSGELAGMVGVYRQASVKYSHKAYLWGLYVAPGRREQGIGRRLVESAIEESATLPDVELLCTSVFLSAATARALYPSCGFVSWGVQPRSARIGAAYVCEEHFVL